MFAIAWVLGLDRPSTSVPDAIASDHASDRATSALLLLMLVADGPVGIGGTGSGSRGEISHGIPGAGPGSGEGVGGGTVAGSDRQKNRRMGSGNGRNGSSRESSGSAGLSGEPSGSNGNGTDSSGGSGRWER